ncbi:MAG: hypothetical protein H0T42_00705, partial [Deltaproteobacteria bacterium]|nr:hypothetical protein [Deltaproteobacteria bacterium]
GLVAAVDRAQLIADRPAQLAGIRPTQMIGSAATAPARPTRSDARVPTLPWLVGPTAALRGQAASTTALGATASAMPAALSHVAWADRWLARFAGATPQSLDILHAASAGSPEQRMSALAAAAPGAVFVAPIFDTETMRTRITTPVEAASPAQIASSAAMAPGPTLIPAPQPVERYDDSAETPDDVFLQIAAAAASKRASAVTPVVAPASAATATATAAATTSDFERYTLADAVAHAAPSAPGAGLSAQLASSPFASALRHVLPLPAGASFDVRSLFGAGLSATYLAGLLAPESREVEIAGATSPMWASWGAADPSSTPSERDAPSFDATYVSPEIERTSDAQPADQQQGSATDAPAVSAAAATAAAMEPLTTLRTALLSWTMSTEPGATSSVADASSIATTESGPITTAAARAMIESMSLPMVGDAATPAERMASWSSPGMLAERAQGWSVAQERSASDLSLDFVTPELVLAARIYGLGPAEAAQAARLAIAGPGHMSAMAGAVDRTFVQAMAIEADRREARIAGQASPSGMTGAEAARSVSARPAITTAHPGSTTAADDDAGSAMRMYASPGAAFGVERRSPRGAFLWPSATVAALGLHAASPDGQQQMPLAALELLAAQAVAEIGTYAALGERAFAPTADGAVRDAHGGTSSEIASMGESASASAGRAPAMPGIGASIESSAGEPAEADVLGAAAALVPASRRARFNALYVALTESSTGRNWSPASRAARALALAGRGDEAPTSAYERAATAWDVLPVVYAADGVSLAGINERELSTGMSDGAYGGLSAGAPSTYALGSGRAASRPGAPSAFVEPMISIDGRAGVGALSTRAGEALGSYVSPAAYVSDAMSSASSLSSSSTSSSSSSARESQSPAMRAPTAAQELVRTGRPAGRYGGGEVEIPTWFESAARKMLEDRSGNADGISMAELTLVSAAPASHVAASSRTASGPAPLAAASVSAKA